MILAPSYQWFPPTFPLLTERWDASVYLLGIQEHGTWLRIGGLKARFREGARMSAPDAIARGLYRPSSIRDLMLHDDDQPPMPSSWGDLSPVGPGDVVLSKFLPVSVAWVSSSTPRRPVDANCVRVIGLSADQGFWLANLLEHPDFQDMLAQRSAGAAIPRIGLRGLKTLRIPDTPDEIGPLINRWSRVAQTQFEAKDEVRSLQATVNAWIEREAPAVPDPNAPRFHAASDLDDSLVPAHQALRSYQNAAARRGCRRLGDLVSEDAERLRGRRIETLRVLRLSHADSDFGFAIPDLEPLEHPTFRVYGRPFDAGEVLLSVLGSSPKVVFHHPVRPATIWLSDHWARFQPREYPGALALVLQSQVVSDQLALAATGAARQFVPRTEFHEVRVPWPEPRRQHEWHQRLVSALETIEAANQQLAAIRREVRTLIDQRLEGNR